MESIKTKVTNSTLVPSGGDGLKSASKSKPSDDNSNQIGGFVVSIVTPRSGGDSSSIGESELSDDFKKSGEECCSGAWRKYRGFLWSLVSSLIWTVTALLVTQLKNYHPINLALWRYQGAFLPALPFLIFHQLSEAKDRKKLANKLENIESLEQQEDSEDGSRSAKSVSNFKLFAILLLRSFLTCNALILHFYSLKYLNLGDALVITSSTPIFAYFFAHYLLGEACGVFPMAMSMTTLMGVVVITKPQKLFDPNSLDFQTMIGVGLALGCTLISTISFISLRWLKRTHYSYTLFSFGSWGTFETLGLSLLLGVFSFPHGQADWIMAGGMALLTFFGQLAIIQALKCESTGPVALVRTCDVIFGYLFQIIASRSLPDLYSLIGASIVVICLVFTAIRKWLGTLPDDNKTKLRFWYLLK